ncbi:A disintegrin and metalloproteinase with thrombospondin motifs 9-like isoform X2 [Artemia franciscana]|uniref:A disintegrin and metalloproteinase with thrombospondin motifs 9-like isoform X2 n=1 Tax=Artemia franciscana TaxID=6661 RepID=UPI0032DA4803
MEWFLKFCFILFFGSSCFKKDLIKLIDFVDAIDKSDVDKLTLDGGAKVTESLITPRKLRMKGDILGRWGQVERKPKWILGRWGQCSTSCGAGERKREIGCYDVGTKLKISKEYCTGPEPDSRKSCISVAKCRARWKYSQWSSCDVTCGKGVVRREVSCVIEMTHTDIKVADRNCDGTIMQSLKDYCPATPPCPTLIQHSADIGQRNRKAKANWRTGPWGEISYFQIKIDWCHIVPYIIIVLLDMGSAHLEDTLDDYFQIICLQ